MLTQYQLSGAGTTALLNQYGYNIEGQGIIVQALGTNQNKPEMSSVAVGLFDSTKLGDLGGPPNDVKFPQQQRDWLEQNVLALVVNRYNGTLFRGE